jgi:hypothetical protein
LPEASVREEQAGMTDQAVQLVEHDPRLDVDPALGRVQFEDPRHEALEIDDDAAIEALAVGAGAAAARRQRQAAKGLRLRDAQEERDIRRILRRDDEVRRDLVDAVVGRHRRPRGMVGSDVAGKSGDV